ncbi:MAG: NfeD family protein [Phycisphaerales bacterium]|nr:NfeD family protein [Phycisphaerales bacterium]
MDSLLMAGIGLILLGALLLVVEAFIPSGGVIGLVATAVAIVGIVLLFKHDTTWGAIGLLTTLILGPMLFFWVLKLLPNTPFGKHMFGDSGEEIAAKRDSQSSRWREERNALLDQTGKAVTDLHPVGIVLINNTRHDAIAKGQGIDKDSNIRVVSVDGMQIEVRQA